VSSRGFPVIRLAGSSLRLKGQSGTTLIEVLIAITLLGLLSVGMLMAMRIGLISLDKANDRLMHNRRVAGANRVLESQIAGLIPVPLDCRTGPEGPRVRSAFLQGEPQSMRFVTSYSLQEAWRGLPRIAEFQVIPGEGGLGVRLIVNERLYTGPESVDSLCAGVTPMPEGGMRPIFTRVEPGPQSFVLADKLEFCQFSFLEPLRPPETERWRPDWWGTQWPLAIRIDMAAFAKEGDRLGPLTLLAPIRIRRSAQIQYVDQ
jgi:hypothetical protein